MPSDEGLRRLHALSLVNAPENVRLNLIAASKVEMLPTSSHAAHLRAHLAAGFDTAARTAFAALLAVSPLALGWTLVARPLGNIYAGYTDVRFFASDLFLILALAFWLLSLVARPRPLQRGLWFLTFPIAGLVILSWTGVLTGIDPALTLYHSVRFTLLLGLYFFLVNASLAPLWVAVPLALGVIVQAIVALGQFSAQHSLGLAAWGELVLSPNDPNASIVTVGATKILRAYGLTEHPNLLGGFLAFALVLMLGYYFWAPASARRRYLLLAPAALGLVTLLVTFSYAAVVAFAASAVLLVLILLADPAARRMHLRALALAGIVLIATVVLSARANPIVLKQNLAFAQDNEGQQSLSEREAMVLSADRLFYAHELFGIGNGALPEAMYKLDKQFPKAFYYQPAHFVILDVAAELGLLGGMLWLWLLTIPWLALAIKRRAVVRAPWLAATAAALLVITVLGFFDYYPWLLAPGRIWQWSAWGLLAAAYVSATRAHAESE
jgi:O-antigen ligase